MNTKLSSAELKDRHRLKLRRSQQLEFLTTVLQSINKNNSNPDIIYRLFRHNLDLLNLDMIEVFSTWMNTKFDSIDRTKKKLGFGATNKLKNSANTKKLKSDRDRQKSIAIAILNLGNLIQQFPLGNKAVNMELSIECYSQAIKVFTSSEDPKTWGVIQNNLATAYSDRIRGDKAENLELSIACYQLALEIRTKADFPINWAMTQNNLAAAYNKRIRGDKAENLELSIIGYQLALEIRTKADFPMDWAGTQNNLAAAYNNRIRGDKAKNLELSISCYRAAMEVYTPETFPHEWAKIQIDLAQFSIENLKNYSVATEHLQSAYEHLLTNNNDTGLLAQTMFELARCFHQTGCLEQAKIYFKDSIRLYQRLEQQTQVAAATSALGNLELQMGLLDDARLHLQTALEFYQAVGNLERVESIQELQQYLPVTSGASGS